MVPLALERRDFKGARDDAELLPGVVDVVAVHPERGPLAVVHARVAPVLGRRDAVLGPERTRAVAPPRPVSEGRVAQFLVRPGAHGPEDEVAHLEEVPQIVEADLGRRLVVRRHAVELGLELHDLLVHELDVAAELGERGRAVVNGGTWRPSRLGPTRPCWPAFDWGRATRPSPIAAGARPDTRALRLWWKISGENGRKKRARRVVPHLLAARDDLAQDGEDGRGLDPDSQDQHLARVAKMEALGRRFCHVRRLGQLGFVPGALLGQLSYLELVLHLRPDLRSLGLQDIHGAERLVDAESVLEVGHIALSHPGVDLARRLHGLGQLGKHPFRVRSSS